MQYAFVFKFVMELSSLVDTMPLDLYSIKYKEKKTWETYGYNEAGKIRDRLRALIWVWIKKTGPSTCIWEKVLYNHEYNLRPMGNMSVYLLLHFVFFLLLLIVVREEDDHYYTRWMWTQRQEWLCNRKVHTVSKSVR